MSRMSFQADYRGATIEVFISCDYALWYWVPGAGQRIIDCNHSPREWIEKHGIDTPETHRAKMLFSHVNPKPVICPKRNLTSYKKSTPEERQSPSMSRENSHED